MYPPKPNFTWLTDPHRSKVLGKIEYVRVGGGNIRITNNWRAENLISVQIPQLAPLKAASQLVHRHAASQLQRLWAAWQETGLLSRIVTFDGLWVPRTIRGNPAVLSNHAYGTAFDINARWNPFYGRAAPLGARGCLLELVPLASAYGFWWGGHWNYNGAGLCDAMHFEWAVQR